MTGGRPVAAGRATTANSSSNSSASRSSSTHKPTGEGDAQASDRKQPSAKLRKKNEEERLLELRKQRIREEEARVRLRNEVLAGKKTSADLKTLVTKSQGSTVLSCGRPPPSESGGRRPMERPPLGCRSDRRRPSPVITGREAYERQRVRDRDGNGYSRPTDRNRYYDDFDEEEDEDMDGFIDDNEDDFIDDSEVPDVSQHIREIFGYDKRKYADFDDDDIQESSFGQIQKEEQRSAKIGRKEDLEDMKMELMKKKEKRRLLNR